MVKILFKRLRIGAVIPTPSTDDSAGLDLVVPEDTFIPKGRSVIPLGFAMQLPKGYAASVRPRSGFSLRGFEDYAGVRQDADVLLGLIDLDYRGECGVIVKNNGEAFMCKAGLRVAQMVIEEVIESEWEEVEVLDETARGNGGFGSTGTYNK